MAGSVDQTTAKAYSARHFMNLGLRYARFPNWKHYKESRSIERFKQHFGMKPETVADCWLLLRESNDPDIRLEKKAKPKHLLIAIRHLFKYHTEADLASFFNIKTEKTVRKWAKLYVKRISRLLPDLIGTLHDNHEGLILFMSIDGVHCPIEEPRPWSKKWSSHKFGGKPALNYEFGVLTHKPQLGWIHGPTKPGEMNDLVVFRDKLKGELPADTRVLADDIYQSEREYVSTKNDLDPKPISKFKDRVLSRHENFNQRVKCFGILKHKFRHRGFPSEEMLLEHHRQATHAVCALVQLQLNNGTQRLLDPYPPL
ncbi:hypothetical protein SEMRO_804_G204910.1 [Seminavis robusta]|uniref:Uncharacterized protein n=1 Tax=Seminavis robusta TaxID=568900 RepID=A0A9N8ECI8_9STRA|nr:hypothetical protein SEMRO_804_G204910.1 [Seminavis robusta]|eukprot:Sro804_g204910.1 n/a (313) ;mRNA; f:23737-24675